MDPMEHGNVTSHRNYQQHMQMRHHDTPQNIDVAFDAHHGPSFPYISHEPHPQQCWSEEEDGAYYQDHPPPQAPSLRAQLTSLKAQALEHCECSACNTEDLQKWLGAHMKRASAAAKAAKAAVTVVMGDSDEEEGADTEEEEEHDEHDELEDDESP